MIIHVSATPLVGSPGKLAKLLSDYLNYNSLHFCENDYPGDLKSLFVTNSIALNDSNELLELFLDNVKKADVIHIHNEISKKLLKQILANISKYCSFIYQTHSPLREGPNFIDMSKYIGVNFDKKLVVAQYHPRLYQSFQPVPNFVDFESGSSLIDDTENVRVLFSPAHNRTGFRWNDKVSLKLNKVLDFLHNVGKIEWVKPSKIHPCALFELRKSCHVTIDEIVTGSFHQISLEGLAAGNVVINNSDMFSDSYIESMSCGKDKSPFYKINEQNCYDRIEELVSDRDMIRRIQNKSVDFHNQYLNKSKISRLYRKVYKDVQ